MKDHQVVRQRRRAASQPKLKARALRNASFRLAQSQGDLSLAVYLSYRDLARYLRYTGRKGPEAARKFAERCGMRKFWRGRAWLVKRADVDAALAGDRHGASVAPVATQR